MHLLCPVISSGAVTACAVVSPACTAEEVEATYIKRTSPRVQSGVVCLELLSPGLPRIRRICSLLLGVQAEPEGERLPRRRVQHSSPMQVPATKSQWCILR